MDIQRLKLFCSVARHLNFSKAAEECHVVQTSMSRSIASLESELGFRLFDRNHHHVELTPAGAYFCIEATKIIQTYEFAKQYGNEIAKTSSNMLNIGFGGYDREFARYYVSKFMERYPDCNIVLQEFYYDNILESLLSGTSDVIFTAQLRVQNIASVKSVLVSESNYVIAVGRGHPLSRFDEVTPKQLNNMTFVVFSNHNMTGEQKSVLTSVFEHYGIKPGRVTKTNSATALTTMLELGIGITFMSENIVLSNQNIKLVRLKYDRPEVKTHVAAYKTPISRPILERFMTLVENESPRQKI